MPELSYANLRMFPSFPLLQTKWAELSLHAPKAVLNPPKLHVRPLLPLQSGRSSAKAIHPCPVPKPTTTTPHTLRGRDKKK